VTSTRLHSCQSKVAPSGTHVAEGKLPLQQDRQQAQSKTKSDRVTVSCEVCVANCRFSSKIDNSPQPRERRQRREPAPRPAGQPFPSVGRLPFVMPCRILVRAHGRSCSQKLRPWRGMSLLSGAPISGSVETQHSISKGVSPVSGNGKIWGSSGFSVGGWSGVLLAPPCLDCRKPPWNFQLAGRVDTTSHHVAPDSRRLHRQ